MDHHGILAVTLWDLMNPMVGLLCAREGYGPKECQTGRGRTEVERFPG